MSMRNVYLSSLPQLWILIIWSTIIPGNNIYIYIYIYAHTVHHAACDWEYSGLLKVETAISSFYDSVIIELDLLLIIWILFEIIFTALNSLTWSYIYFSLHDIWYNMVKNINNLFYHLFFTVLISDMMPICNSMNSPTSRADSRSWRCVACAQT